MIDRFSNDVVFFFFIRVVDHYRPKVYVDMWGPSSESGLSLCLMPQFKAICQLD